MLLIYIRGIIFQCQTGVRVQPIQRANARSRPEQLEISRSANGLIIIPCHHLTG